METENKVGMYDYDRTRQLPIAGDRFWDNIETISIGIFQWEKARSGVKAGKAVIRVKGSTQKIEEILAKVNELCNSLNKGTTSVSSWPKTLEIK